MTNATKTEPREVPMLFVPELAQAMHVGLKTETRRPIVWRPIKAGLNLAFSGLHVVPHFSAEHAYVLVSRGECTAWQDRTWPEKPPIRVGDRIWVRESWYEDEYGTVWYAGDPRRDMDGACLVKWKPNIHMPRRFCRTVVEVTDVRPQRILSITDAGAFAEGFGMLAGGDTAPFPVHRQMFLRRWREIYGERSIADNDWVWVYTFKRVPTGGE